MRCVHVQVDKDCDVCCFSTAIPTPVSNDRDFVVFRNAIKDPATAVTCIVMLDCKHPNDKSADGFERGKLLGGVWIVTPDKTGRKCACSPLLSLYFCNILRMHAAALHSHGPHRRLDRLSRRHHQHGSHACGCFGCFNQADRGDQVRAPTTGISTSIMLHMSRVTPSFYRKPHALPQQIRAVSRRP